MNLAKAIEVRLSRLLFELERETENAEFEDDDLFRYVRDAAALWERSLKKCSLARYPNGPSLFNLTNALEFNGVGEVERAYLHALRIAANKGKHVSHATMNASVARSLIKNTAVTLSQLAATGIGELAVPQEFNQRRLYLVDVFDHYVHGDIEYQIYLNGGGPRDDDFLAPVPIERFTVKFGAEEQLKQKLADSGHAVFRNPDAKLPEYPSDDYIGRWEWEGTHRDLLRAFVPYQWEAGLLPGLSRGDWGPSVLSAAALALVDVARPATWEDVLWKMSQEFGIWRRGTVAKEIAQGVTALCGGQVTESYYGPRWLSRATVISECARERRIQANGFILGIDKNNVLLVGLDLTRRGVSVRTLSDADLLRPDDPLPLREG